MRTKDSVGAVPDTVDMSLHYDSDRSHSVNRRAVMLGRRLAGLTLVAAVVLATAGCSTTTASPPKHDERLVKAAGLTSLKIRCHKDVWKRTGESYGIKGKFTKGENDIVTVEISGPQLADLLEDLDRHFDDAVNGDDPVAERLYKALAPVVDGIKATPRAGDPVPEVVVDDAAGVSPSRTPSPSVSPTP